MTDGEALLKQILESPGDTSRNNDTLRLVYADWLEENGDVVRAEFIRNQIELGVLSREHYDYTLLRRWDSEEADTRSWVLVKSCNKLLNKSITEWVPRGVFDVYARIPDPLLNTLVIFRRGFVDWVECSPTDWFRVYPELLANHPVREVAFRTQPQIRINSEDRTAGLTDDPERKVFGMQEVYAVDPMWKRGQPRQLEYRILRLRWPGIVFHLPGI